MGLFSILGSLTQQNANNKGTDRYIEGLGSAGQKLASGADEYEGRIKPLADYAPSVLERLNNTIMNGDMTGFYNSPDYQYNLDQTTRGLNAKAAQQGTLMSGNTLKALQKNASGLASQNYGSYINNLNSIFSQANPYFQAYSQIPYMKAQDAANIQMGQAGAARDGAFNKGNIQSGMLTGIDNDINQAAMGFSGMGGVSSMMGSSTPSAGWGTQGTTVQGMPWLNANSGGGIPQFGSSYGFGGF